MLTREEKIEYIKEQIEIANKSLVEGLADDRSIAIGNILKYINDEDLDDYSIDLFASLDIDISDATVLDSTESYERFVKKMISEGIWND